MNYSGLIARWKQKARPDPELKPRLPRWEKTDD